MARVLSLAALIGVAAFAAACSSSDDRRTNTPRDASPADTGEPDAGGGGDDAASADTGEMTVPDAGPADLGPAGDGGPPPAIIVFAPSMDSINFGESVLLLWNTTGANSISVTGDTTGPLVEGSTDAMGMVMSPPLGQTTRFTLTAMGTGGSVTRDTFVGVNPGIPMIVTFTANPNPAPLNGTTTLSWQTMNASRVRILQGANALFDSTDMAAMGSWVTGPLPDPQNAFTLEASNIQTSRNALVVVDTQ